jgi:hypothetical protein
MATVLAANGTFYQCVDWRGVGYTDLKAFRLEPGMSEFTIISEARASLSFHDDVPLPYWVQKENGQELNITEDEFYVLLEKYNNPGKLMDLAFVPLHPDIVDPWQAPRPLEEPLLTELIECPQSYSNAPIEYKSILDDLYLFSERIRLGETFDYIWENAGELGFEEPPNGEMGYATVDLNNDNISELLLGSVDSLNNASPSSVFMLKDGKPILLISFWSRSSGVISADKTIYSIGSGGAAYTYLSSYNLGKNADTLTQLSFMGSDYSQSDEKPFYYQEVNGRNRYISEREFDDFLEKYIHPSKTMELTVFPIAG